MDSRVCAVIVSYNDPERLRACVLAVSGQVGGVVIVDNGDGGGLDDIAALPACAGKAQVIRNGRNEGLAFALNQGIRRSLEAEYDWTLLMDQDSVAAEGMVPEMLRSYDRLAAEVGAQTAMVVPVVSDREFGEMIPSVVTTGFLNRKIRRPDGDQFVHFHITSGSLLKNSLVPAVGMMNESFFIDYIDFDHCFRVVDAGYRILLSRDALLYHALAEPRRGLFFSHREHNAARVYYQTRNSLLAMSAHGRRHPSFLYFEFFRLLRKPFKILLLDSHKGAKLRMYLKGIADFLKQRRRET